MLSQHFSNADPESTKDVKEHFSALPGGYVLEINQTIRVRPECCGSLQDIHEWKSGSKYVKSEEEMLTDRTSLVNGECNRRRTSAT